MIEKKEKVFYGFEFDSFKTVMKANIENIKQTLQSLKL
jgi:hypothetical protein